MRGVTAVRYATYDEGSLPALVAFWNRTFSKMKNFFPVTEEVFAARVTRKRTAVERFEPAHMILAHHDQNVVGMIHVGIREEEFCRLLYPDWSSGMEGYIAAFGVDPAFRRRGIGSELWDRAIQALAGCRRIVVDGQCLNPFYGNSERPFTPFFGTPEGISIAESDAETRGFLARRGFHPRFRAVHLACDLQKQPRMLREDVLDTIRLNGYGVEVTSSCVPTLGARRHEQMPLPEPFDGEAIALTQGGKVVAALTYFRMAEVSPSLFAIYRTEVAPEHRGHGLGGLMARLAFIDIEARGGRTLEVLTVPELSPDALEFYRRMGFVEVGGWLVY